ncbi:MAG: hypothetical protein ACK5SZ_02265, partial [bacterium]
DSQSGQSSKTLFDAAPFLADQVPATGDRRKGGDRRADAPEGSGFERRRGPGRRLSDFARAAEQGELTKEQFMFLMAIEAFKRANGVTFPAWTDVVEVIRLLGYRKTCNAEISLPAAEDWLELPSAPSNVRPERWHLRKAS